MKKLFEVWELDTQDGEKLCAEVDIEMDYINIALGNSRIMAPWHGCGWQKTKYVKRWAEIVVKLCEEMEKKQAKV